jgi:hypothetical protein
MIRGQMVRVATAPQVAVAGHGHAARLVLSVPARRQASGAALVDRRDALRSPDRLASRLPHRVNGDDSIMQSDPAAWLTGVQARLRGLWDARTAYAPRLAPDFSVFNFILPDENGLSAILVDLLNPRGSHGQGDLFLRCFLDQFWREDSRPCGDVEEIKAEARTSRIEQGSRRMDVRVKFRDGVMVIENKPWAGDQKDQVRDYLKDMAPWLPNARLFYLTRDATPPSEGSIDAPSREEAENAGRLRLLSYRTHVREWLSTCQGECQSERVRVFIDDFIAYLRKTFEGVRDMTDQEAIVKAAIANADSVEAALAVAGAEAAIRSALLEQLCQQMEVAFRRSRPGQAGWELHQTKHLNEQNGGFRVLRGASSRYVICLQFEGNDCNNLEYGVAKSDDKLPHLPQVFECLNDRLGLGTTHAWWPWQRYMDAPYRRWRGSINVWREIADDGLAKRLMDKVSEVYEALEDKRLLDSLS